MADKAVINLATGLEDPERVLIAFLVGVAALDEGRPTAMFLTKDAVHLALPGTATGPVSPPFSAAARVRRSRPPLSFSGLSPWHFIHDAFSSGATFSSKYATCSLVNVGSAAGETDTARTTNSAAAAAKRWLE